MNVPVELTVHCGEFNVHVRAKAATTVGALKKAIKGLLGIETERQIVNYGFATVTDEKWITHHINEVYLIVLPSSNPDAKLNVTVKLNDTNYQQVVEVKETDTVMSVKQKIVASSEFKAMIVAKKVREIVARDLELWRKENVEMRNELPLAKYYIHEGCKIDMEVPGIDFDAAADGKGNGKAEGDTSTQFELEL